MANLIAEGITSTGANKVVVNNVKDINLKKEDSYDLILIGSPVHFGKHVGSVKNFINKLPKSKLNVKAYSVFNTYMGDDSETTEEGVCGHTKMLEKMDVQISEKMPNLTKIRPGLPIRVNGMKGPISKEELPKCKDFGMKLIQG